MNKQVTEAQKQALTYLTASPEVCEQLRVFLGAEHMRISQEYEAVKEALVFNEPARAKAQVIHGRLLMLQEIRNFFETK